MKIWYLFKYFIFGIRERKDFFDPNYSYYDEVQLLTPNFLLRRDSITKVSNVSNKRDVFTKDTFELKASFNMDSIYERSIFNKRYMIKKVKNWKGEWIRDEA